MSDHYKLIILPEAQRDIGEIGLYIAQELFSPHAALSLLGSIQEEIQSLSYMPTRIKTIDEEPWGSQGVRKIRVNNYYIYFLVDDSEMTVKINAVIYVGRDQEKQMVDVYGKKDEESNKPVKRFGIANGKFKVPPDEMFYDDEIAEMFEDI